MDTVKIFDTTLRDGEQSPGISLDVAEKLEIAEQLARLGVDVIEAGFPIACDGDFESVEAIAKAVRGPIIAGLSRTGFKDVDRAWEAVRHAETAAHPRVHRDVGDPHGEEAPDDAGPGEGRGRGGGRTGQELPRRRRVLARGRLPLRSRVHVRGVPDRGRQRRDHAEHPRHRRLRGARGLRQAHRVRHRQRAAATSSCRRTATTIWASRSRTRSPASRTAPARSSARSTASASAPATPRSKRS